jgi:Leucine-rich repeat (LRR) protein
MNNSSDHTPINSMEAPAPPPPPSGTLNELQMAMFKRRTKVDDTTAPIVSPRQKRRNLSQHHIPMSPTLQEKLRKQLNRVDNGNVDTSPQNSLSTKSSTSLQQRLKASKTDGPKVSLSVLPSPIPSSPNRNHIGNGSVDSDDRSRVSVATNSTTTTNKSRLPPLFIRNLDDDAMKEEAPKENDIAEEEDEVDEEEGEEEVPEDEEVDEEEEVEPEEEEEDEEVEVPSESETSILYGESDIEETFMRSDDDNGDAYASSDDGINIGSNFSSSGDEYLYAASDDNSTKATPRFSGAITNRQRNPARRRRRRRVTNTIPKYHASKVGDKKHGMDDSVEPSFDESGPTYFDEVHAHEYPIASDTEDECDPLAGFDRADKFAKSDSFLNESNHNNNLGTDSSENNDGFQSKNHNDDAIHDGVIANDNLAGESEDEIMVMYASTSTGGPMYDEQTVDESILFNDVEKKTDEADDLVEFVKERSSREFNDFGDYVEEEVEEGEEVVVNDDNKSGGGGKNDSCHTSLFSYSQTSADVSAHPTSLSSKSNNNIQKESIFGGKVVDGRVDRDVPLGDEDDASTSTSSGGNGRKSNKTMPYARVCSRPMIIALILVGSVVIGVILGLFLLSGNDDTVRTTNPPVVDTTKPEIDDPTRSKIPPEHVVAYDIICPLLTECNSVIDTELPSGKAFEWLVQNKTANPDLETMQNRTLVQRYALAAIYYSIGGDSWADNTNWLTSADICDWFSSADSGSGCGIEGQTVFTSLQLDTNNVKGEIPFELSLLTELTKISIQNPVGTDQYLKGTLPSNMGKLTSLTSLVLSGNQFSSGIPTEIGLCTSLSWLDLNNNGMNGEIPTSLSSLTNLTSLNLEGNFFAGSIDPAILKGATNLIDVNFEGNKFTGLPETIVALNRIQTLMLGSNNFATFPMAITQLSTLTSLDLSGNRIMQSIPPQLGRMTTLQKLDLSHNQLTGVIPVEIGNLINLELLLDVSFNLLTGSIPSRIGQLTKLQRLRLDGNRLNGAVPGALASLTQIKEIRLDDNSLTGAFPAEVCTLYNVLQPASYADCNKLQNATCITNCCSGDSGCVCQFEKTDPLLCIKDLQ